MKNFALILSILFSPFVAFSQAKTEKFGKIDPKWFEMQKYDKDTSAAAVILFDVGTTSFSLSADYSTRLKHERHIRIKIFNSNGYDAADFDIPYYRPSNNSSRDEVSNIKAVTYHLVGGKQVEFKVDNKSIFDEKLSDYYRQKKFTLPNLTEGCIIEISYTYITEHISEYMPWYFQSEYPTIYSEYNATIIEVFDYKQFFRGYVPLTSISKKDRRENLTAGVSVGATEYQWIAEHVPAFKNENYITTREDYITKMVFELSATNFPNRGYRPIATNWKEVVKLLMENQNFGVQFNRSAFLKDILVNIKSKHTDSTEYAKAIYTYIQNHMTWNERNTMLVESTLKSAYDKKIGNSADINLLLMMMLREAGFKANPIILSTRANGKPSLGAPIIRQYNYVLVGVILDNKLVVLDACDKYVPFAKLPKKVVNGIAYLISDGNVTPVDMYAYAPLDRDISTALLTLAPNGVISGKFSNALDGNFGFNFRSNNINKKVEDYEKDLKARAFKEYEISNVEFKNMEDIYQAPSFSLDITLGDEDVDIIYINPMLSEAIDKNPLTAETRAYPVDFGTPFEYYHSFTITIPDNYKLDELPKNISMQTQDKSARFTYAVGVSGNKIQVLSRINVTKPLYLPNEYKELREFYNQIVAKHQEQIVLKKVKK